MTKIILAIAVMFVPIVGASAPAPTGEAALVAEPAVAEPPTDEAPAEREAAPGEEASEEGEAEAPETEPAAETKPAPTAATEEPEAEIKPRLELFIPSVAKLVCEARRSHTAPLAEAAWGLLGAGGSATEEGASWGEVLSLIAKLGDWPDTSVIGVIYAPDIEGRPRAGLRLDYPVEDLYARLSALLAEEAATELFKGITIEAGEEEGYVIRLPETDLAYLVPAGREQCYVLSHADIEVPEQVWGFRAVGAQSEENGDESPPPRLLYCRYNLVGTEKDTGSIFGDVPWVRSVNYWCQVNDDGLWEEQFAALWNPLVAFGVQQVISQVKGAYYVPADALGFAVVGMPMAPMLETTLELPPGGVEIDAKDEACVCVLPGSGFFPVPEIVFQMRVRKPDKMMENLAEAADKVNRKQQREDQPQLWYEEEVQGHRVFWQQPRAQGGLFTPFVFRPVLFTQNVTDPKGKKNDLLILAMTSTDPEGTVRRWLTRRTVAERRAVPTVEKLHWQGFIQWKRVYELVCPWINMAASISADARLLPPAEEMADHLADSEIDVRRTNKYLLARHLGPIPVGSAYLPGVVALAGAAKQFASTDLAREREAVRNLRVLYHHSKLFKKDYGRWPAEVWELDGYVDFEGNPRLLNLQKSSKAGLKSWFEESFTLVKEEEKGDEGYTEEDQEGRPDTSLYVINWGRKNWTLGLKKGALDHLERLYIDQDGKIHRVEKPVGAKEEKKAEPEEATADEGQPEGSATAAK